MNGLLGRDGPHKAVYSASWNAFGKSAPEIPRTLSKSLPMIDQIALAIVEGDGGDFLADHARCGRLAVAALKPLARPSEPMIDAAYEAVRFDESWAINSRRDFQKAVRAMVLAAMVETTRS